MLLFLFSFRPLGLEYFIFLDIFSCVQTLFIEMRMQTEEGFEKHSTMIVQGKIN